MKCVHILAAALLALTALVFGDPEGVARLVSQAGTVKTVFAAEARQTQSEPTIASLMDREISAVEEQIVAAAEAMPEGSSTSRRRR